MKRIDYDVLKYFTKQGIIEKIEADDEIFYIVKGKHRSRTVDIFESVDRNNAVTKEAYQRLMDGGVFVYRKHSDFAPSSMMFTEKDRCSVKPPYFAYYFPGEVVNKKIELTEEAYARYREAKKLSKLSDSELIIQMSTTWMEGEK